MPDRHPDAPSPGEPLPSHYRMCFGCGPDHPTGLHMRVEAGDGLSVVGRFTVSDDHQGAPGLAHGGVLSLAFDEAPRLPDRSHRTASGHRPAADLISPTGAGRQHAVHRGPRHVGMSNRKIYTMAEGRLEAPDGPVGATRVRLFVTVPLEHFVQHGRREDIDRVVADPDSVTISSTFEVNP